MNSELARFNVVLVGAGIISASLLKHVIDMRDDEDDSDQHIIAITCNEGDEKRKAVDNTIEYIRRIDHVRIKTIYLDSSFNYVESWLAKCIHDNFEDEEINNMNIYLGYTVEKYIKLDFNDDKINSIVQYPYMSMSYSFIAYHTLIFDKELFDLTRSCDDPYDDYYCGKCHACLEIKNMLKVYYSLIYNDRQITLIGDYYRKFFKDEPKKVMVRSITLNGVEILIADDSDNGYINYCNCHTRTNRRIITSKKNLKPGK